MKKTLIFVLFVLLFIPISLYFWSKKSMDNPKTHVIALTAYWKNLVPPKQSNSYSEIIISNVFHPLVTLSENGLFKPGAALSWTFSDDRKRATFKIDTSLRFSNGVYLTAEHVKKSWEDGLGLEPISANSSLADALSKIVGFEEFQNTHTISGIKVIDRETLEVNFTSPFRMVLDFLSGSRYSVYLKDGNNYLGTGPFKIESNDEEKQLTTLVSNEFYTKSQKHKDTRIIVKVSPGKKEVINEIKSGATHLVYQTKDGCGGIENSFGNDLACMYGGASSHSSYVLNANSKTSIFSKLENRQALQAIYLKAIKDDEFLKNLSLIGTAPNISHFLPFQKGYLTEDEVNNIVAKGNVHIDTFLKETEKNPIRIISITDNNPFFYYLKKLGVKFFNDSLIIMPFQELLNHYYKTFDYDIISMGFGVSNGDPDELYHLFGKHGAITSPRFAIPQIHTMFENGRELLSDSDVDSYYKNVNKKILELVPILNLGFIHASLIYNKKYISYYIPFKNDVLDFTAFYQ